MPPYVVVLEGPDGAGKSHHADALAAALRREQHRALAFHHHGRGDGDPYGAALDYAMQRHRLLLEKQNEHGLFLIADRWTESTLSVGLAVGGTEKLAMDYLYVAEEAKLPVPFERFFLDAPDAVLDARLSTRSQAGEVSPFDVSKRAAARQVFRGVPCVRVDTTLKPREVTQVLLQRVLHLWRQERR